MNLTDEQVELLDTIDGFFEFIEGAGEITQEDIDFIQKQVDNLSKTIIESKAEDVVEECPFLETDND